MRSEFSVRNGLRKCKELGKLQILNSDLYMGGSNRGRLVIEGECVPVRVTVEAGFPCVGHYNVK